MAQPLENGSQCPTKQNLHFPSDPAALLLPLTQEKLKHVHTDTYMQIFITALFVIIKNRKTQMCIN